MDIRECPVLVPELAGLLAPVKTGSRTNPHQGEQAELHATASDTGIDLSLKLARRRDPDLLMEFSRFAADIDLARLCWNGEPVVVNRAPQIHIGRVSVSLPAQIVFCNQAGRAKSLAAAHQSCGGGRGAVHRGSVLRLRKLFLRLAGTFIRGGIRQFGGTD